MKKLKNIIIYMTGTGLGSGYAPLAPGTAGSLVGVLIYYLLPLDPGAWLLIAVVVSLTGIPVASYIEKDKGTDPGLVVIDEVCGQWIALLFLPRMWVVFILAFILFRFFDIWKPYPISRSQNLKGGLGIMADDILAGILANILIQLVLLSGVLS